MSSHGFKICVQSESTFVSFSCCLVECDFVRFKIPFPHISSDSTYRNFRIKLPVQQIIAKLSKFVPHGFNTWTRKPCRCLSSGLIDQRSESTENPQILPLPIHVTSFHSNLHIIWRWRMNNFQRMISSCCEKCVPAVHRFDKLAMTFITCVGWLVIECWCWYSRKHSLDRWYVHRTKSAEFDKNSLPQCTQNFETSNLLGLCGGVTTSFPFVSTITVNELLWVFSFELVVVVVSVVIIFVCVCLISLSINLMILINRFGFVFYYKEMCEEKEQRSDIFIFWMTEWDFCLPIFSIFSIFLFWVYFMRYRSWEERSGIYHTSVFIY